jgi:cysteine desulfuration protein SufE
MTDIKTIQAELEEDFAMFDDWTDKYEYIIDLGKELPLLDESEKTEELLIKGCQSRVWLKANMIDDKVVFKADSDAIITKGIIALMIRVLSNQTPQTILDTELGFIENIGLKEHLSPTRSNGLVSMIKQMKMYALAYKAQQSN